MLKPITLAVLGAAATAALATPERQAQALLDALRDANGVPGMSAAVWQDGSARWQGVSGWRDLENQRPVQADTRFRLASVSKLFAATATAQLKAEGKLKVDAPVGPLLPELDEPWDAVTPTQLSAHLSGMPHYQLRDAMRGATHYATARESLVQLKGRTPLSEPGQRYAYSSWGFTLLGAAAEAAAGQPYLALLGSRIAPGLAIGPDETGGSPSMSKAYQFAGGGVQEAPSHDYSYSWGGAGLAASAPALAEWGGRVLQGRIVDLATRDWMWQPVLDGAGRPVGERGFKMGFGWRLDTDADGQRTVHHAGVTTGARSVLLMWPRGRDGGTSVSLLSNALWTASIERSAELLSAPFRPPVAGLPEQACPVQARRFEGDLEGVPIEGRAGFQRDADGLCRGEISLPAAMAKLVNQGPQPAVDKLAVIGLQGELGRAALVTPIGLADWRARPDGSFQVEGLAGRRLQLRLL